MQAGKLRQLIEIQSRTISQDTLGQAIETWAKVEDVWADVRMAGNRETFVISADQQVARVTHKVRMRYKSYITPLHRIIHGDRVLDIESAVDPDGRRRMLLCECVERVGESA